MLQYIKTFTWSKKTQLEQWIHDCNLNSLDFIRFASCFGVGFLCGLLMKQWAKNIVIMIISLVIVIAILQGFSILSINVARIEKITGIDDIKNLSVVFFTLVQQIKKYACEVSCSGIGFIVGFKTR